MKKLLLLAVLTLNLMSCEQDDSNETLAPAVYDIEGKWLFASNTPGISDQGISNTMYIFENGTRYTYYCVGDDCESQYETFEAGDSNAIPGTNEYTFEDSILTIDLNFGNIILSLLIIVWAIRLGSFLFIRIKKAGEDIRFREIKKSPSRFFMTWTLQGMWVSICSACALSGIANGIEIDSYFYSGLLIFTLGFITEIIADNQKSKFRKEPNNKDKFITTGIWKYSRHPNYLGELTFWMGCFIAGLGAGFNIATTLGIIGMILLFNLYSIPKMEQRQLKTKKNYQDIIDTIPRLLPLQRRK